MIMVLALFCMLHIAMYTSLFIIIIKIKIAWKKKFLRIKAIVIVVFFNSHSTLYEIFFCPKNLHWINFSLQQKREKVAIVYREWGRKTKSIKLLMGKCVSKDQQLKIREIDERSYIAITDEFEYYQYDGDNDDDDSSEDFYYVSILWYFFACTKWRWQW